jgi:hypothetical protein
MEHVIVTLIPLSIFSMVSLNPQNVFEVFFLEIFRRQDRLEVPKSIDISKAGLKGNPKVVVEELDRIRSDCSHHPNPDILVTHPTSLVKYFSTHLHAGCVFGEVHSVADGSDGGDGRGERGGGGGKVDDAFHSIGQCCNAKMNLAFNI